MSVGLSVTKYGGLKCLPPFVMWAIFCWVIRIGILGFEVSPPIYGCMAIFLGFEVSPTVCGYLVAFLGFEVSPPVCGYLVVFGFWYFIPYVILWW